MEPDDSTASATVPEAAPEPEAVEAEQPRDPGERVEEIFTAFVRSHPTGADRTATCRFDLEGAGGGSYVVRVAPDGITRESAESVEPDIRVALSVEDFLRIADGTFDGELAIKSERIELSGDLELASLFVELVNHGDVLGISRSST